MTREEVMAAKESGDAVCPCCGRAVKWPDGFYRDARLRGGRQRRCKGCVRSADYWKARSSEYTTWVNMRQRCGNPANGAWANYGGRGIRVCERWRASFEAFIGDMGMKPVGGGVRLSLDRVDNDGNYEPGNCRWATCGEQMSNRRNSLRDDRELSEADVECMRKKWLTGVGVGELAEVFMQSEADVLAIVGGGAKSY